MIDDDEADLQALLDDGVQCLHFDTMVVSDSKGRHRQRMCCNCRSPLRELTLHVGEAEWPNPRRSKRVESHEERSPGD